MLSLFSPYWWRVSPQAGPPRLPRRTTQELLTQPGGQSGAGPRAGEQMAWGCRECHGLPERSRTAFSPDGPRIAPSALRLLGRRPGWRQHVATCPHHPRAWSRCPGAAGAWGWSTGHLSHLDTCLGRLLVGSCQARGISQGQRVTVTRWGRPVLRAWPRHHHMSHRAPLTGRMRSQRL